MRDKTSVYLYGGRRYHIVDSVRTSQTIQPELPDFSSLQSFTEDRLDGYNVVDEYIRAAPRKDERATKSGPSALAVARALPTFHLSSQLQVRISEVCTTHLKRGDQVVIDRTSVLGDKRVDARCEAVCSAIGIINGRQVFFSSKAVVESFPYCPMGLDRLRDEYLLERSGCFVGRSLCTPMSRGRA